LKDNKKNKYHTEPLPHNDHFFHKLELFQPSARCLAQLADPKIIKGDCTINYVEFAIDFMTDNLRVWKNTVRFFNRHLVHLPGKKRANLTHHHNIEDETVYFSSTKDKKRLVMYNDKPSRKGSLKKCHHLEYRVSGWSEVKEQSIFTIKNLINFDHEQLWDSLLDFRKPN